MMSLQFKIHLSGYVNNFDQLVEYQCPNEGIPTGVDSVHSNRNEDRRFKFRCCQPAGKKSFYILVKTRHFMFLFIDPQIRTVIISMMMWILTGFDRHIMV